MRFLKNHIYFDPDSPDEFFLFHNGKLHLFTGSYEDQYVEYCDTFDPDDVVTELEEIKEDDLTTFSIWDLIRLAEYKTGTFNTERFLPMTWYRNEENDVIRISKNGKSCIYSSPGEIDEIPTSDLDIKDWIWLDFLDANNSDWVKELMDSILDEE